MRLENSAPRTGYFVERNHHAYLLEKVKVDAVSLFFADEKVALLKACRDGSDIHRGGHWFAFFRHGFVQEPFGDNRFPGYFGQIRRDRELSLSARKPAKIYN